MCDDKGCLKKPLEDDQGDTEQRYTKAKRHDVEIPMADIDIKLAEKLDNILKISFNSSKPKFLTNRPKDKSDKSSSFHISNDKEQGRLVQKDLTKEQLKQRLLTKYETLVPELLPDRPKVRVVKILSASESIELGKDQARKQMERQLELNSISHNQEAFKQQFRKFKFNDGYERSLTNNKQASLSHSKHEPKTSTKSKSVRFAEETFNEDEDEEDEITDEDDYDEANEDFIDND